MLGTFISKDGKIFVKGRSVKNKPIEPVYSFVGNNKTGYMKTLLKSYRLMKFTDFNIIDLYEMSLKQWKRREFPIPKGYVVKYSHSFDPNKLKTHNWNFRKKTAMDLLNS